jgi:hypothetical protein
MPAKIVAIRIVAIAMPAFAPALRPPPLLVAPPLPPGGVPVLVEELLEVVPVLVPLPVLEGRDVGVPVPWGPA